MILDMSYFRKILITKCHVCGCVSVSVFYVQIRVTCVHFFWKGLNSGYANVYNLNTSRQR